MTDPSMGPRKDARTRELIHTLRSSDSESDRTEALEQKHPEEAEGLLREAIRMNPRQRVFWHNLAIAYDRLGRYEERDAAQARELQLKHEGEPAHK